MKTGARGSAETAAQRRVGQPGEPVGQHTRIVRRDEEAVHAVCNDLARCAGCCPNGRQAEAHPLQIDNAEALIAGRDDQNIRRRHLPRQCCIVHAAPPHHVAAAKPRALPPHAPRVGGVGCPADHRQPPADALQACQRPQEHVQSFARDKIADV